MSTIEVNKITPVSGGTAIQVGESGDTITVPSGATITNSGTANNFTSYRPNAQAIIINGDCSISQRGTANADESTSGIYRVDRMNVGLSSIGEFRLSQETLTSGNAFANGFTKAFRIDCAVADASPAASDIANMTYKMEGNTVQAFKKGTANAEKATLSFWVRCSKTGTAQVNLIDGDNSRMVSGTYTVSSANTWEQKIINFPADTTGALDNDNNKSLELEWALDAGSDFTTGSVQTSWGASSNVNRSVNDFAIQDNTANDWAITAIQLEVGEYTSSTIPPFQHESYADNLQRCQRYYYKYADESENGGNDTTLGITNSYNGGSFDCIIPFPVSMRSKPSIEQNTGSNMWRVYSNNANDTFTALSSGADSNNTESINVQPSTSVSITQGNSGILQTMDSTAYLSFAAEL